VSRITIINFVCFNSEMRKLIKIILLEVGVEDCYGRTPYSGVSGLGCLPGRPGWPFGRLGLTS